MKTYKQLRMMFEERLETLSEQTWPWYDLDAVGAGFELPPSVWMSRKSVKKMLKETRLTVRVIDDKVFTLRGIAYLYLQEAHKHELRLITARK